MEHAPADASGGPGGVPVRPGHRQGASAVAAGRSAHTRRERVAAHRRARCAAPPGVGSRLRASCRRARRARSGDAVGRRSTAARGAGPSTPSGPAHYVARLRSSTDVAGGRRLVAWWGEVHPIRSAHALAPPRHAAPSAASPSARPLLLTRPPAAPRSAPPGARAAWGRRRRAGRRTTSRPRRPRSRRAARATARGRCR